MKTPPFILLAGLLFWGWLPITTFGFLLAQTFNERPAVPLTAISLVLRWRRRQGNRAFASRYMDISYPYFFYLPVFRRHPHEHRRANLFLGTIRAAGVGTVGGDDKEHWSIFPELIL